MQMSMRWGGLFHHQHISCRSVKFLLKSYNYFSFRSTNVTTRQHFYCLTIIDIKLRQKLLLKARGVSPVQIGKNTLRKSSRAQKNEVAI